MSLNNQNITNLSNQIKYVQLLEFKNLLESF